MSGCLGWLGWRAGSASRSASWELPGIWLPPTRTLLPKLHQSGPGGALAVRRCCSSAAAGGPGLGSRGAGGTSSGPASVGARASSCCSPEILRPEANGALEAASKGEVSTRGDGRLKGGGCGRARASARGWGCAGCWGRAGCLAGWWGWGCAAGPIGPPVLASSWSSCSGQPALVPDSCGGHRMR